jgi:hypothetical protein
MVIDMNDGGRGRVAVLVVVIMDGSEIFGVNNTRADRY